MKDQPNDGVYEVSITKRMYGWTKYGGAMHGMVKEELNEWNCQACGEKQLKGLPAYMIPEDDHFREYFRVCANCKARAMLHKAKVMADLLELVNKPTDFEVLHRFANLLAKQRKYK